jgi:hypothetical protein
MTTPLRLSRREALAMAVWLGLGSVVSPIAHARGAGDDAVAAFAKRRASDALRRAGSRCRAAGVRAESTALLSGYAGTSDEDLARHLSRRVREDFERDRVVAVGPWLLSETEAVVLAYAGA